MAKWSQTLRAVMGASDKKNIVIIIIIITIITIRMRVVMLGSRGEGITRGAATGF